MIRRLKKEDISDIKNILETSNNFNAEEIECAIEIINTYFAIGDDYEFFCYEHEQRVIGYICYGPTPLTKGTFDLYWICVSPEFQNKGIGLKLLEEAEKDIKDRNGRLVIVETSSHDKYLPAIEFYKRNEFSVASVIENFYCEGEGKIILIKRLNPKNFDAD